MVPKIHKKGRSFRVTASYVLHDPHAKTNERVAWTETRNLATSRADMAWRVMAATAMDQDRLKQQAGIPNTGRKSKDHVLHFTLSWHPEEAEKLDQAEMLRATKAMLHVMEAQDHQCLIVAHSDQPQPHVHVIVNRVHPRDGRILGSSFEKLKASRWAQRYEEERGKVYCAERVINNAARDRGEHTRGEKDLPRHVHEAASAANDNSRREALLKRHRIEAAKLKRAERELATRQKDAWQKLETGYQERETKIDTAAKTLFLRRLSQLRTDYRPRWEELHHEQQAQNQLFKQRESKLMGRVRNMLESIDFKSLVGRDSDNSDGRAKTISEAFGVIAHAGARRQAIETQQRQAQEELLKSQRASEEQLKKKVELAQQQAHANNRKRFETERSDCLLRDSMDKAQLRAQWQEKSLQLRDEIYDLQQMEPDRDVSKEPKRDSPTPLRPTSSADLLPRRDADQAARQIDTWRELQQSRLERDADHDRDDEWDR